jgi:peptide/nickel transport system substrate-binding protein
MKNTKKAGVVAGLAALALVVTACSGGGGQDGDGAAKTGELSPTGDINATAAADVQQGGTLTLPLSQLPSQWNYGQLDGALVDAALIESAILPQPFRIDEEGVPQIDEDLVTSAEATSEDPLVVTYDINPDATWNDGTPITVADFQAWWTALKGTNAEYLVGSTLGPDRMASVEPGTSDKQVVVTYSEPFSDWKSMFAPLYPAKIYNDPTAFNTAYVDAVPISAGPYKIDEIDQTAQTVTMVPDDNWWGEAPKLDTVIFRALDGDADIDAYLNGEIDQVYANSSDRYDRVKDADGSELRAAPSARYTHVDFSTKGLLADESVRQAIQHAVDREALGKVITGTLPYEVSTLNNHLYLSTDGAYQDNAGDAGDYDAEEAGKILDDAGWEMDGDVRAKDGEQLAISVTIPSGTPISQQLAEVMQSQLGAVGIKLDINAVGIDQFFEDNVTPGNYDMTIFVWAGTGYQASSVSIYNQDEQGQNYGRVSSDEISSLLDEAVAEGDPDAAADLYNQADEAIWEIGHSMPIIQQPLISAQSPELANYGARAGATDLDWTIVGFTK